MNMMMKKSLLAVCAGIACVQFTGCGTLFHPERKGQKPSNVLDPAVMVPDCCGLLLGIIPGAIALALDFSNNTIYYTKAEAAERDLSMDIHSMKSIHVADMSKASIESALSQELGYQVSLNDMETR